jgi:hypothetical protein
MNVNNVKSVIALALVAAAGMADAAPIQFQRVIGTQLDESPNQVIETRDGGYLTVGVKSISSAGDTAMWVIKYDYTGATQWDHIINNPVGAVGAEEAYSVVQTRDGGYAIVGDTTSGGAGLNTAIVKLDPAGNLVWARTYFGSTATVGPRWGRIWEWPNGDLVVVDRAAFQPAQIPTVIRTTAAGAPVWAWGYRDLRVPTSCFGGFLDVKPYRNGSTNPDIVAVGYTSRSSTAPREALVMRLRPTDGLPMLSRVYSTIDGQNQYMNGLDVLENQELAITGRDGTAAPFSYLWRLDPAFNTMVRRIYPDFFVSNDSIIARDGRLNMVGTNITVDVELVQMDLMGQPFNAVRYGTATGNERGQSLASASEGWIIAGDARTFFGGLDEYLIRTNINGRSGCNENVMQQPATFLQPFQQDVPFERQGLQFSVWNPVVRDVQDNNRILCIHCPADFNGDNVVDFFDYLDFVAAFDAANPSADFNGDNVVDFFDYLDFAAAFDRGC